MQPLSIMPIQKIMNRIPAAAPLTILNAATEIVPRIFEYLNTLEQNKLRIAELNTQAGVMIEQIIADKQLIHHYLEITFEERRQILAGFLHGVEKSIEQKDSKNLELCLSGIITVLQTNPLNDIPKLRLAIKNREIIEI